MFPHKFPRIVVRIRLSCIQAPSGHQDPTSENLMDSRIASYSGENTKWEKFS